MKECKVTISGDKEIVLGALTSDGKKESLGTLTNFEIKFDTIDDDTREKSGAMIARMKIKGKITKENRSQVEELSRWARDMNTDTTNRTVLVEMLLNDGMEVHGYKIPNVFVVDYQETHTIDGEKGTSTYEVSLTQQHNYLDETKIF